MADFKPALELDEIKKMGVSEVRKAYDRLSTDYNKLINGDFILCPRCNTFKPARSFYNDRNNKNGLFYMCKECVMENACDYDKINKTYIDNKDKAITMLQIMDLPYISSVYKSEENLVKNNIGERNRTLALSGYLKTIKSLPQYSKLTWKDSEFDPDDSNKVENKDNRTARKEIKKIFGSGFTERDYLFLQDSYDDFRARTQVDSISQEIYVKQICMSLLEIDRDRKNGKDVTNKLKSLDTLMNSANLQPRQRIENTDTDTVTFGQLIEKWEETKPISVPGDEFIDCDKIGSYLKTWFGWICMCLGIKNAYYDSYKANVDKYTVSKDIDIVEDEIDDDIYSTIFGNQNI